MIEFLIAVFILVWFSRQFYGARAEKWKARGHALKPVGRYLKADAIAIRDWRKDKKKMFITDEDIEKLLEWRRD